MYESNQGAPRPRNRTPKFLTQDEVCNLIEMTLNKKHKAMIALLYGCGLRSSELINIRLQDVNFSSRIISVLGKGSKYRLALVHLGTWQFIAEYLNAFKPSTYLFEGKPGYQYSVSSLQKVVRSSGRRAHLYQPLHAHILRHSFATHNLEAGCNLYDLKNALGHVFLSSTEIYLHCSTAHLRRMSDLLS